MADIDDIEGLESYEDDVGLGAEDKKHAKGNQLDWFKGEKGRSYRTATVYFHPIAASVVRGMKKVNPKVTKEELVEAIKAKLTQRAESLGKTVDQLQAYEQLNTSNVQFKKTIAHYKEGVGYAISRLGKDGPEADSVWKMMGDSKTYFTTALLIYPTDREGTVLKEQLNTNWMVVPWRIGPKVYGAFHTVANSLRENGLSIATQDLLLKCTNTEFQNFDISAAGPAIWTKNAAFSSKVLGKAFAFYDKLVPFREMSTADLRIKLGIEGASSVDAGVGAGDEFGDLLGQV